MFILESNLNDLKLLRNFVNWKPSSKTPQICLPSMSEDRFVSLCKTMYDLIGNSSMEQEMHNNISKISNFLTYILCNIIYNRDGPYPIHVSFFSGS